MSALDDDDFYQVLGVPYTASGAEIDRAYRQAMRQMHPDRQRPERRSAAEEAAKRLNLAYATLSKPPRRLAYDRTIRARVFQDQIMSRYVGGFHVPANDAERPADAPRRSPTAAERREQAEADRSALVSLLLVFGAVAVAVVAALVVWAVAGALFEAVF